MEIFKRKDKRSPYWFVSYTDPNTGMRRRESLKTANKDEARSKAEDLMRSLKANGGKTRCTLGEALDAYVKRLERDGKASAGAAKQRVEKLLGRGTWGTRDRFKLSPDMDVMAVTPALCERLVEARADEGNSPQTIAHELKDIRAALRVAQKRHLVPRDMLDGSTEDAWAMPKLPVKTRYLTLKEFLLVYAYLDPGRCTETARGGKPFVLTFAPDSAVYRQRQDAQDLLVALACSGGRWSEVASLRWDQIDLEARIIRLWGNKTQKERLVGCPEMLHSMLTRRLASRREEQPLVFPTLTGQLRTRAHARSILKAMDACGLNTPEKVAESGRATVHSLRHTYASLLAQNGASLAELQDALGHTTIAMTKRYTHLLKAESAQRLAGIMNKVME